jgi:hypothetical protein
MSSSKQKTQTQEQTRVRPSVPSWIQGSTQNLQSMIDRLSGSNPIDFVAGPSTLQNAAYSAAGGIANRMGVATPPQPAAQSTAKRPVMDSGPVSAPMPAQPDWGAYIGNNPDLGRELARLNQDYPRNRSLDRNQDGRIGPDEYGPVHRERFGANEGRPLPTIGQPQTTAAPAPVVGGQADDRFNFAGPAALTSPDPNNMFSLAGLMAGQAGQAGPSRAETSLIDLMGLRDRDVSGASAASVLENLDAYMNPYLDDVVSTSLAGFDEQSGRRQAALDAAAAGSRALGGSRYGLERSNFMAQEDLNRGMLESGLRSDAFGTGAMLSADDANRRQQASLANAAAANAANAQEYDLYGRALFGNMDAENLMSRFNAGQDEAGYGRMMQAAGLLGSLGATVGGEDRANVGLLAGLGDQQRDIDQDARNAYPTLAQLIAALQGQQPYGMYVGQDINSSGTNTTRDTPSLLDTGRNAAATAAIMFSDARLKENVRTAGYDANGRRWVDFSYIGDPQRYRGVIAQEVAQTDPDAVIEHESGYLQVDYAKLN